MKCKLRGCKTKAQKPYTTCSEPHRILFRREYRRKWQLKYKDTRKRNRATPEYRAYQRAYYHRKKLENPSSLR